MPTKQEELLQSNAPEIYFNDFKVEIGPADLMLTLLRNGKPVAVVNMSYTIAKTLTLDLAKPVKILECKAQREILTCDYVASMLK